MIVLDCSVSVSCMLQEPGYEVFMPVFSAAVEGKREAHVPALFYLELTNAFRSAYLRKRFSREHYDDLISATGELSFVVDYASADSAALPHLVSLSEKYRLSLYDTSYLELAVRLDVPLATLDKQLMIAAREEGVLHD